MVSGCANTFSQCGTSAKRDLLAHYASCYVWKAAKGEKKIRLAFSVDFYVMAMQISIAESAV